MYHRDNQSLRSFYCLARSRGENQVEESSGNEVCFGEAVGFMDGTHLVLENKPSREDYADFFNRKGDYSINALAIVDLDKRIRYLFVGFPGSVHDVRPFDHSSFGRRPMDFLSPGEYVLADGGYKSSDHVIIPCKRIRRQRRLGREEERFGRELSNLRVTVENAFGLAKARFQSLRCLRARIITDRDVARVVLWIRCCFVLHNFLLDEEGLAFWSEEEIAEIEAKV